MKKVVKSIAWVAATSMTLLLAWSAHSSAESDAALAERIKPVGEVCMQGDANCAATTAAAGGGAAKSGEEVYNTACTSCHSTGAAGAPKVGDAAAWSARLTERGGKDGLYTSAINGFKGMPAKGLCMTCTDDELKGAVDYMLGESGQ